MYLLAAVVTIAAQRLCTRKPVEAFGEIHWSDILRDSRAVGMFQLLLLGADCSTTDIQTEVHEWVQGRGGVFARCTSDCTFEEASESLMHDAIATVLACEILLRGAVGVVFFFRRVCCVQAI